MPTDDYLSAGPLNLPLQGAIPLQSGPTPQDTANLREWSFQLWAPDAERVDVELWPPRDGISDNAPKIVPMQRLQEFDRTAILPLQSPICDYYVAKVSQLPQGTTYRYVIDGQPRPDPASRWQPQGVHAWSALFDPDSYQWGDSCWQGLPLRECIFYELHVGTLTEEGTFESAISTLPHLVELGVTAIEIMPVAQFPGDRNWGYDGTFLYAIQHSYGGPEQLQKFVDSCHQHGLAVFLDVVYNHVGNEGNPLWGLAHYFSTDRQTPWGPALNWDGRESDPVREFFIENALYWLTEFHLDGLRLDAVDCIVDSSVKHLLQEMQERVEARSQALGRPLHLIAESATNDPRYVLERNRGGYGIAAQWTDDFHNSLYALLCGDRQAHYQDFGSAAQLVRSFQHPFVFTGQYSHHYRHRRGLPNPPDLPPERSVVFALNHDRVGNRSDGLRLNSRLDRPLQRLVAGLTLLSPYLPLLFMGEEYGDPAPFYFFTDYSDAAAIEGVRSGRPQEMTDDMEGGADLLDPQNIACFERSRLNSSLKDLAPHQQLFALYKDLIRLRQQILKDKPRYEVLNSDRLCSAFQAREDIGLFGLRYQSSDRDDLVIFCLPGGEAVPLELPAANISQGRWTCQLNSNGEKYGGTEDGNGRDGSTTTLVADNHHPPFGQPGVRVYSGK